MAFHLDGGVIDLEPLVQELADAVGRELGAVHWSHPAYANKHIFVRNDKEILKASLAKEQ